MCPFRRSIDTPCVASKPTQPFPGARCGREARWCVPWTSLAFPRQPDVPMPTRAPSIGSDPRASLRAARHYRSLRCIRSPVYHTYLRRRRYHGRARLLSTSPGRRQRSRTSRPWPSRARWLRHKATSERSFVGSENQPITMHGSPFSITAVCGSESGISPGIDFFTPRGLERSP
jgi:hypothetical protein